MRSRVARSVVPCLRYRSVIPRPVNSQFRHRALPERTVGDQVVVARPRDRSAVLLGATAAIVWRATSSWTTVADLESLLAERHSDVGAVERSEALDQILEMLFDDELLERHPA